MHYIKKYIFVTSVYLNVQYLILCQFNFSWRFWSWRSKMWLYKILLFFFLLTYVNLPWIKSNYVKKSDYSKTLFSGKNQIFFLILINMKQNYYMVHLLFEKVYDGVYI